MDLYVIGGQQKPSASQEAEWHKFSRGKVLRIDPVSQKAKLCLEYESPKEVVPDVNPSITFKSSSIFGDLIYLCTQTEILVRRLPDFDEVQYYSLPQFNDIHHVLPTPEGMFVANTGLDMIIKLSTDGEVLEEWNVMGKDPWHRFSKDVDYRKLATTKPHESHPNFVFLHGDDIWVTRFEQNPPISLTDNAKRLDIGIERVHDGVVRGDSVYLTTVNGHVVGYDLTTQRRILDFDLNQLNSTGRPLGWCRGLHFLDDNQIVVGFSAIRKTKFVENVRWLMGHLGSSIAGRLPTRLAAYDIQRRELLWECLIENHGLNAVFSILAAEPQN